MRTIFKLPLLFALSLVALSLPAVAEQPPASAPTLPTFPTPGLDQPGSNPYMQYAPPPTFGFNPFTMILPQPASPEPTEPYTMRRPITQQEKIRMMQMALPFMTNILHMNMADSMNYFARKYKAKKGLSFDDVRDSLFLRANIDNVKKVGENLMWKDMRAVLHDDNAPRIEVYSFCDIAVARELLKISPEFVVFLPCRIAIMEDGQKNIWVLMLDWSLDWVKGYETQLGLSPALVKGAIDLNSRMDDMMRAAANGDL